MITIQNQLYHVEQKAAQVLADHIANDPPKALMAVVSPQAMGGWSGPKRHVEGGGAPCPSEFLLHKQDRATEKKESNADK